MSKILKKEELNYPALGRAFLWVENPRNQKLLLYIMAFVCFILLICNGFYVVHGHFAAETIFGFYAVFGFIAFSCVVFGSLGLRYIIKRDENFYGKGSIDCEKYPPEQTQQVSHDQSHSDS